jgi:hypothetical protein
MNTDGMTGRLLMVGPVVAILLFVGFWRPVVGTSAFDSEALIESGLAREVSGDIARSERDLLGAARVDRLFQPRWTLAGFYFRQKRETEFWKWSRSAFEVGTRDLGALFELCWRQRDDGDFVWLNAIPERPAVWREYLLFLMESGRWPAASPVARKLAGVAGAEDQTLLLMYVDLAIEHHDERAAWDVWMAMSGKGQLPLLTNGMFAAVPTGHGFDWRVPMVPQVRNDGEPDGIRFTLSGFQPEKCVLLEQPLALQDGAEYRFRFEYKTDRIGADAGLHWEFDGVRGAGFSSADWRKGEFAIRGRVGKLALVYERAPGTTMAEGVVFLRRMEIAPL